MSGDGLSILKACSYIFLPNMCLRVASEVTLLEIPPCQTPMCGVAYSCSYVLLIQVTHHWQRKTLKLFLKTWVITFVPLFRRLLGTRPNQKNGTEKKRGPGRPPKERKSADEYQSAIACHLAADALCRARYSDLDFRILARARSEQHLKVLEALYIQSLKPVLCRQKQFVTDLKLFHRPRP